MKKDSQKFSSDSLYLQKLEFQPDLKKTWLNFFVANIRVVFLFIILVSFWGVYSFFNLPRESNPEVKIPIAVITVSYMGVSPADMEELVTKKIETNISGVSGINQISSNSSNSFSAVTVEFAADQDIEDSIRKLRDKLSDIRADIPEDANDPQIAEISLDDTPVVTFALTGPYDDSSLRLWGEKMQDELEKISDVREVKISGGDETEFEIAYNPQKLALFGISVGEANQVIASLNQTIPSGNFEGKEYTFPIRVDSRFFDADTIRNIALSHADNGALILVKDVAEVSEKSIKKTVYSRISFDKNQPTSAVTIQIIKRTGGNIIEVVTSSKQVIESVIKTLPKGVEYQTTSDMSDQIKKDFSQLTHDFFLTISLVFFVLFLFVGLKEAFVAGVAIPLVFFVTFGVMLSTGTSLNFLSLFSLLLSLGLLVDDAIVVVSAIKQYMRTGKFTPEEAVLLVLRDYKVVLLSTTLATVWAFLPLLLATGLIGEFIKSIPLTVSITLISSLVIAIIVNPALAAALERVRMTKGMFFFLLLFVFGLGIWGALQAVVWGYAIALVSFVISVGLLRWYCIRGFEILEKNEALVYEEWKDDARIKKKLSLQGDLNTHFSWKNRILHGIVSFDLFLPWYERYLRGILLTKKRQLFFLFGVLFLFIFSITLPLFGVVKTEFFPEANSNTLYISVRAPTGLVLEETDKIVKKIEEKLLQYEEIENFSTLVGNPGMSSSLGGSSQNNSNTASLTLQLIDFKERERTAEEIAGQIRQDIRDIQGAVLLVEAPRGGPPSGSPFQVQISGDDLQELDRIAHDLRRILDEIPGVVNSDISLRDAPAQYTFSLSEARMELYNLDTSSVGSTLRTALSGTKITTIMRDNKDIEVIARFGENFVPSLDAIQNLQILNTKKQPVFLKDVATIELVPSVDSIFRIDQRRTVLLTSGVTSQITSTELVKIFQEKTRDYDFPEGYSIVYGGENEQNAESVLSIIRAMAVAGILIISTLIIQFNSFRKSIIVLVTLPLALIGVFLGMAMFGVSLSFPGLIGILALFGIVVKNAIILIDKINLNLEAKIPFFEAIIDAGKSRLEAIVITSFCTIAGILPITLSNETWMALGSAVIFGLSISSFLTLFVVPTLYVVFASKREKTQ